MSLELAIIPVVEAACESGDSEKTQSVDFEFETGAQKPQRMYFNADQYTKTMKMSSRCYISKAVERIEKLSNREKRWFYDHPQFGHFFHMPREALHKWTGMLMLLVRTACLETRKECWFIINGVPVRYSLREMALISGLYCHPYPRKYEKMGNSSYVKRQFDMETIRYEDVEKKIESMPSCPDRLNVAVLYFLCSVIKGKRKGGEKAAPVEPFFLKAAGDLELCKTFPWGRMAFDANMDDISHMMRHMKGVLQSQWLFPSFVTPLEVTVLLIVITVENIGITSV